MKDDFYPTLEPPSILQHSETGVLSFHPMSVPEVSSATQGLPHEKIIPTEHERPESLRASLCLNTSNKGNESGIEVENAHPWALLKKDLQTAVKRNMHTASCRMTPGLQLPSPPIRPAEKARPLKPKRQRH